ncbi:MAG: HAD hydrolase family protein [Coriobacteriales bacterium]|nr:HAD hydrolase family protein [Coriobacteriales bacterium]
MRARGTAFASDFDGTLCQSNWITREEYFDPAVLDAIKRYQEAGGLFGVCTGRPLLGVTQSVKGILDLDFYIVTTGAQVLDRNCKPIFERVINIDVAQQIYERYVADDMFFLAATDDGLINVGRTLVQGMPIVASLGEIEDRVLGVSLECHENEQLARRTCEDLNRVFGDLVDGFQNLGSVDVVAKGCSKGSGVRVVREAFGVATVAGAGDSYNDLPLLRAADVSYTFHESPQEVRDAATCVVANLAEALADFV